MNINSYTMLYETPASEWVEALPLGNGKLGAMVFSGTEENVISLNYDELWSGVPEDLRKPEMYKYFEKARELVFDGKYMEAQELLEKNFNARNTNAYLPLGDIVIKTDTSNASNFSRQLNIRDAVASDTFTDRKNGFKRTYFISYPKNCLVCNLESVSTSNVNISINSQLRYKTFAQDGCLILDGTCFSASKCITENYSDTYPEKYLDGDKMHGIDFRGAIKIIADGKVELTDDCIKAEGKHITLFFSCESSYNGFDKHPYLEGKPYKEAPIKTVCDAANIDYACLLEEHIKDFRQYYDRVELNIAEESEELVPMVKRFKDNPDKSLYELLFNFGRYLTISSSRPGSQATNLQGIWNFTIDPPWQSNYTININTEMNYYPTLPCNLAEFDEPLVEFVNELVPHGEETAKDFYNAGGFCAHHNSDIWRITHPMPGAACWSFWPMSGGWFCHNLFEHYEYTLDKDYLEKKCYPVMNKAVRFYLDLLVSDKDGYLIFAPSTSPENRFLVGKDECAVSETTTMTMAIIKDLFANFISACEILGIENVEYNEVKEKLPKLLPFKIGKNGRLLEWYNDEKDAEVHHRHCSHLYALYPSKLINPIETPELTEAVKKTLEIRGDDGTGWSLGWKICFWARLMDGDHALKLINMQLRPVKTYRPKYGPGGGTYPNMFDAHPPFQIDGNFGAAAGIAEMFLQTIGNKIYLLPALPTAWSNGSIKGLRAKGNLVVDIAWADGKVTDYTIHGNADGYEIVK